MSFADDLARFAADTKEKANTVVRKVVLDVGVSVVTKSPVGDPEYWLFNRGTSESPDYVHYLAYRDPPEGYVGGHFRANWQYGDGAQPDGEVSSVDASPGGSVTIGAIVSKLPKEAAGKIHYLVNNLPYALRLEDGWSRQAPAGMVGLTVAEFHSMVEEAVREVGT